MTAERLSHRPKAILFDLDDTLISAYRNPVETWRGIIAEHPEALGEQDAGWVTRGVVFRIVDFLSDHEARRLWRLEADTTRRLVIRQAFHKLNLARPTGSEPLHGVDADRIADRFETYLNETMRLKPMAIETLDALAARGLALALLTNGSSKTQRRKIAQFDLAPHFQLIRIEEEVGTGKPEPAAYHGALDALGMSADDTWMIGDDPIWDVAMPRRLGMGAILFDDLGGREPDPAAPPHAILTRLTDLLPLADQSV
ncbi:HAD family hydrolase [Pseudorhodobacter aquimaris]|uniref:HAD family hydrolase n=1 Tax=Pseudorhodobacter aquimaris TaxID=687412 RepID=UPI00067A8598|nr:HAD family hydrolase [Pseudorhodobacter aquimaris]